MTVSTLAISALSTSCALVALAVASAFACAGEATSDLAFDEARVAFEIVDADGRAIPNARIRFEPRDAAGPASEWDAKSPRMMPFPLLGTLRLDAVGFVSRTFDVAIARADEAVVDLGRLSLEQGIEIACDPSSARDGTIVLPLSEGRSRLRVEDRSGLRYDGAPRLRIPEGTTQLALWHPDAGFAFVEIDSSTQPISLAIDGSRVALDFSTRANWLLAAPVEVRVTVRGVEASWRFPGDAIRSFHVPTGSEIRVQCDAPGTVRFDQTLRVDGHDATLALTLEALPLAFARIEARDVVTQQVVPIESLVIGRARANQRDRIDFAPEWNTLVLARDPSYLVAAPRGMNDLLLGTATHHQALLRRASFDGTRDAPSSIVVPVEQALPIQGIVTDAATNAPVPQARITLRKTSRDLDDLPLAWKIAGTVGFLAIEPARADGRFTLRSTAFEDLTLEVEAPGFAPRFLGPLERKQALDLRIALERGFSVEGRAENHQSGDMAYLIDEASNRRWRVPVAADGTFRFEQVATGSYRAHVGADDRAWAAGFAGSLGTARIEELHHPRDEKASLRVTIAGDRSDLVLPRNSLTER